MKHVVPLSFGLVLFGAVTAGLAYELGSQHPHIVGAAAMGMLATFALVIGGLAKVVIDYAKGRA